MIFLYRLLALALCFTLVFRLLPVQPQAADSTPVLADEILALQEKYPEGMACTNSTPLFQLTVRCPGCIISAEGCWGFAILFVCELYGLDTSRSLPVTWMEINKNIPSNRPKVPYITAAESLQIGDILAAVNPSHAMVVIAKDDSGVTLAEGNRGGRIHYGSHLSYAAIDQHMAYVFRITPPSTQQGEHTSCPCSTFADMPAYGTCEHEAIDWAYTHKPFTLTAGTSSITFSPDAIVTRAQALTFLWRAAGKPEPASTTCPFADIASDAYYRKAVLWGVEKGITCGTSPTTFSPKKNLQSSGNTDLSLACCGQPCL